MTDHVFVAWGFQGADFTLHFTREGALGKVRELAAACGYPEDDVAQLDGDFDELDGFTVERYDVLP